MRFSVSVFVFAGLAAAMADPAPFPFPVPSAEDQFKWSRMEVIPRGCPGGDGNTCCPSGYFSVSIS